MYTLDLSLPTIAERYLLARPCCADYARQIRSRAEHWVRTMGTIGADRISAETLSAYILQLEQSGLSGHTVRSYRTTIMALVRFAGYQFDGQIRRPRMHDVPVDAWLIDEIRTLVAMASDLRGILPNGVPCSVFWRAAIHSGYSTGMAYGDLMRLRVASIPPNRALEFSRHKTGKVLQVRFSAAAMAAIREHGRDMVLPWAESDETFRKVFSALVRFSGVRRGTFKWLRRSAGSYADIEGRGPELLGNTRSVFDKHYRVRAISSPMPPEPPEL